MVPAIPVFVIHVLLPGLLEVEMPIALPAVVVILALYVVLPPITVARNAVLKFPTHWEAPFVWRARH